MKNERGLIRPINWNAIEDSKDKDVWDRLVGNFWLPEKIPVSNDIPSWESLSDEERDAVIKVFVNLTSLDTLQGVVGATSLMEDAVTPHEEAVLANVSFMEAIHAKSYSTIFQTLSNTPDINAAFEWAETNPYLTYKIRRIQEFYENGTPATKKIASTVLESFLFFSGFYIAFHFSSRGKLTNTADIIRLIVRDETVHGHYIGYKYQQHVKTLDKARQDELKDSVYELLYDLYENEVEYTKLIYGPLGLVDDVNAFLRYNANKALNNLGYEGLFPVEETRVSAPILTALDPGGNENFDFFSGSGSSYVIGRAEDTQDEDWDF